MARVEWHTDYVHNWLLQTELTWSQYLDARAAQSTFEHVHPLPQIVVQRWLFEWNRSGQQQPWRDFVAQRRAVHIGGALERKARREDQIQRQVALIQHLNKTRPNRRWQSEAALRRETEARMDHQRREELLREAESWNAARATLTPEQALLELQNDRTQLLQQSQLLQDNSDKDAARLMLFIRHLLRENVQQHRLVSQQQELDVVVLDSPVDAAPIVIDETVTEMQVDSDAIPPFEIIDISDSCSDC